MKTMYQLMIGALSFFVMAGAFAGQEGYGRPMGSPLYKSEFTCTPFHSSSGQVLVGAMAPELVSAQGALYIKTGAVSPFAHPVFTLLSFTKSMPMNDGAAVEIYQASSITVHVVSRGTAAVSATIQYGSATAVCQPVTQ